MATLPAAPASTTAEAVPVWRSEYLDLYPMDPGVMVARLEPRLQELLHAYVLEAAHSDQIADMLAEIGRRFPDHLRVKELFETMEAYRRIGQDIYEHWRAGRVEAIFDLACGHGLLGLLLANRFPKLPVMCVDRERRPAFERYLEVARDTRLSLPHLRYIEADLSDVPIGPRSYVICIHGCNEVTRDAIRRARAAGACFAVMPCCIRDGIYIRRIAHLNDQMRYAVVAGVIAGASAADKVTAIDPRITNRNLIVLGAGGADCRVQR
jgi:hypothetical protein